MLSAIMHTHFSCDPVRLLRIAYSSRTARLSLLAHSLWISTLSVTTAAWCKLRSQSRFVFCAAQTNFLIICPPLTHTFTSVWWQCVYAFDDSEFCVPAGQGRYPMLTCLIVCVPSPLWQVRVRIVPREQGQPCQRMPLCSVIWVGGQKEAATTDCVQTKGMVWVIVLFVENVQLNKPQLDT